MGRGLNRRTVIKAGFALAAARPAFGNAFAESSAAGVRNNGTMRGAIGSGQLGLVNDSRPRFRYWWPGGDITPDEVTSEVNAMADAGFGGFEIGDVTNSEHVVLKDPEFYFGSSRWNAGLVAALQAAKQRNLKADLYIGPGWPAVVAGIHPDDAAAMKELTYGITIIPGGGAYNGPVPPPHSKPSGLHSPYTPPGVGLGIPQVAVASKLEALHVARVVGGASSSPIIVEQATLVELTALASDGSLSWTAPEGGDWIIIASYSRGTAMIEAQLIYEGYFYRFTDAPAYVVDHFARAGSEAVIQWWERDLLSPEIRSLLSAVGETFFEDSLEFATECHWTPRMVEEFETRRGYALKPYLPLVQGESAPVFAFENISESNRIRWDYQQTLSDLFIENHLAPLNEWAGTYGMAFRHQTYGAPVDSGLAAAQPGVPEGESLEFGTATDCFRVLAAGRDLGHRTKILSSELGGEQQHAYKQTFASLVQIANLGYSAGVNAVRIHGFPYAASPTGQWPGFLPWAPLTAPINFAEAWGPRQPQWAFIDDLSGYMDRVHNVLRTGANKVDIAVYREGFDLTGQIFAGDSLTREGFNYQIVDSGLFSLPSVRVNDGVLDRAGPAYKAIIIADQRSMLVENARKILTFARAGLPVILVGQLPSYSSGYRNSSSNDKELAGVLSELCQTKNVLRTKTTLEVPVALQSLGIRGSARAANSGGLNFIRRVDGEDTHYFIHNSNLVSITDTITFAGSGAPYAVEPWSGKVSAIARYNSGEPGFVQIPISASAGESVIITISSRRTFAFQRLDRNAVSATAEVVPFSGGVAARVTAAGDFTAELQNGQKLRATVGAVPQPLTINAWNLEVEDWQPAHPRGVEKDAMGTRKVIHNFSLNQLKPWHDLPGLVDASGIGEYTAAVTLSDEWASVTGARLEIGDIGAGSVRVSVNGLIISGINQITRVLDLGGVLKPGNNVIKIWVATTLINRLRQTRPTVYVQPGQTYGLLGPVRVVPYVDARLS